jgi:hypothetical protein
MGSEPVGTCGCKLERVASGLKMVDCPLHAAAPELLEALKGCMSQILSFDPGGCNEAQPYGGRLAQARAAIAKATKP